MTSKAANALAVAVFVALLMLGSHVNGMAYMCADLGGTWEGRHGCQMSGVDE